MRKNVFFNVLILLCLKERKFTAPFLQQERYVCHCTNQQKSDTGLSFLSALAKSEMILEHLKRKSLLRIETP